MSRRPTVDRFWAKVDKSPEGCWLWVGTQTRRGYGIFHPVSHITQAAHRWAYEALVGPIPEGLELDHLCRVPSCVNPDHLEPVTHLENCRRVPRSSSCPKGHPFDGANTYYRPSGHRVCRACRREGMSRANARKRAA